MCRIKRANVVAWPHCMTPQPCGTIPFANRHADRGSSSQRHASGRRMLLKHIMLGGTMAVKHEPLRPTLPSANWRSHPRAPRWPKLDTGRTGQEVRSAPNFHRLSRTRRAERLDPEPESHRRRTSCLARGVAHRGVREVNQRTCDASATWRQSPSASDLSLAVVYILVISPASSPTSLLRLGRLGFGSLPLGLHSHLPELWPEGFSNFRPRVSMGTTNTLK